MQQRVLGSAQCYGAARLARRRCCFQEGEGRALAERRHARSRSAGRRGRAMGPARAAAGAAAAWKVPGHIAEVHMKTT